MQRRCEAISFWSNDLASLLPECFSPKVSSGNDPVKLNLLSSWTMRGNIVTTHIKCHCVLLSLLLCELVLAHSADPVGYGRFNGRN